MIKCLEYEIEKRAERAECLGFCNGIKILKIKDTIASMLKTIGSNEIFEQYTVHDISHVNEMLNIAEWLIPEKTKEKMTDAEWLMLTLAIYLHDLGMVVSKREFEQREKNSHFMEFKRKIITSQSQEYLNCIADEKFLYQEYVRENHAFRIREWLENRGQNKFGVATEQCDTLNSIFQNLFEKFKNDLGIICESHHKEDLDDFNKYKIISRYGNEKQSVVNLNYIAIILRCADLLHVTNDRTPSVERKLLDVSNPVSILEWEKQRAVRAVAPQSKRNSEGNVDNSIEKDTIEFTAYFSGADTAEAYFGLSSYLQYVKKELSYCNKIARIAKKQEGSQYDFPWKNIDESNITTEGFEAKKLEFTIEQDNILKLLVGHTLYNDSSVVVRELTQNAIDAIKLQNLINSKKGDVLKRGKITIEWESKERILSFSDNGTGMTISDIENYLLKVGASKYRQKQFQDTYREFNPISRFGIGILTCFMVANDIDIETSSEDAEEVNILCLRNVNGKYLLKKKPKDEASQYIKEHGTIIRLHIRPDVDMGELEYNLRRWIVLSEIEISLIIDREEINIANTTLKEAIISFLKDENYNVDDKTIKVEEKTIGNVTVACALRYNRYLADWSFFEVPQVEDKIKSIPLGTCVEGIRVEFTTPGYNKDTILALANITGSKYQTNVARTALEYDSNNEVLKSIYDCYRLFIEEQIANLEKQNFSKSWAIQESHYLMTPLIKDYFSNEKCEPIDEELLLKSLSEIKCVFVEKDGKREAVSVNALQSLEKFDILEYKMIEAIELLFKEFPTDITVTKMIQTVLGKEESLSDNCLITNFDEYNVLHNQIIKKRQASGIRVDRVARKIQLTYDVNNEMWKVYDLPSEFQHLHLHRKLFLPIGDFKIEGLVDGIGVKTIGGIYLNSDSELCKYIRKVTDYLEGDKEGRKILYVFLETVFGTNFLENVNEEKNIESTINRLAHRRNFLYDDTMFSKMWEKIDLDEFKNVILLNNHVLFSLDNWTRLKDVFL